MGRRDEKAQPARLGRSTAVSLPPVPRPRESCRTQPPPLPLPLSNPWPSGPLKRQVAAPLPRRAANSLCPAPPSSRCPRPQPLAHMPAPEPEPALRFSLRLTPEAALILQKRRRMQQQQQLELPTSSLQRIPDVGSLLKVSLLNERHRYDGEEYEEEEEEAPDSGVLEKCCEWLRGVESATRAGAGDRLRALPHLRSF